MSLRRPPTAVTLLVLLLQVVFALLGSGLVLCQEAEGEVSFEWSGADCCSTAQTAHVDPGSSPQASNQEQGDCSGCEDSVLDQSQQRAQRSGPPLSLPYPCLLALPELPHPQRRPSLRTRLRSPGGDPLGFLRTIIIRC